MHVLMNRYEFSAYSRLHCTDFTEDSGEKLFFTCALVKLSECCNSISGEMGLSSPLSEPLSVSTHLQNGQPVLLKSPLINLVLTFFVHILHQVYCCFFLYLPLFLLRLPLSSSHSLFLFVLLQCCLAFLLKTGNLPFVAF